MDPHTENYFEWTPYNFVGNNPIILTDPTGMDWYYDENGNVVHVPDSEGEIKGTNLTWMAPEGATVADPTVIVANSEGETQGVGFQENKEMSLGEVGGSLQYNELIQGIHEATEKFGEPIALAMAAEMGGIVAGGAIEGLLALRATSQAASKSVLRTTIHGAERIAGPTATRGGVLTEIEIASVRAAGTTFKQANGAIVKVQEVAGRYNVVVQGDRGVITTFKNLSDKSLSRLSKNYGWTRAK